MTAENEIGEYRCPDCKTDSISFEEMEPDHMLRFFCRICQEPFKVKAGVLIYQVSLVQFLKEKYP